MDAKVDHHKNEEHETEAGYDA